jgi:hypothetical protein
MTVDAALVREQGITFAVICVRNGIVNNPTQASETIAGFAPHFGFVPLVLVEQDSSGRPTYYGRRDIVDFLANISMDRLPWRQWHLN